MDRDLAQAEQAWRATPGDPEALAYALAQFARAGAPAPWELIAADPYWARIVGFARDWFERPLDPSDGCQLEEIEAVEGQLGFRLPPRLRQWYRLMGRHPALPGLRGPSGWGFSDFQPLESLAALDEGWLCLLVGHQGNGRWGLPVRRQGAIEDVVYADDLGFGWLDEPAPIGSLSGFYLASLADEFAQGGARGRGLTVRQAVYWPQDGELHDCLRRHFAPLDVPSLFAASAELEPELLGDSETLVVCPEEPVFVHTRTEAAWRRVVELIGEPTDPDDLHGPGLAGAP